MATKRQRRLYVSVLSTVLGVAVLVALGLLRQKVEDTDLADPSAGVTTEFHNTAAEDAPRFDFVDVTAQLGIDFVHGPGPRNRTLPEDTGSGLAWGDYDGDGDDDLFLVGFVVESHSGVPSSSLYRNDGESFVDVTARSGVGNLGGFGMGARFADFDNDRDLDLYVTNYGQDRLYRNRGDGSFEDVTLELGLENEDWSIAAAWGDYDRDGLLDLYVSSYVDYNAEAPDPVAADGAWQGVPFTLNPNSFDPVANRLYRQRPEGDFEEVAILMGVDNPGGRSLAASFVDIDNDGWLDLYVANDVSPNALFHNRGAREGFAIFEDWSAVTGVADERGSMGISVADLAGPDGPQDGRADFLITHWVAQENALYVATSGPSGQLEYRDRIRQFRLGEVSTERVGWGSAFADLDLDGRLDILIANGSTLEDGELLLEAQLPFVFWNGGDRFHDVTEGSGDVAEPRVARGLAISDYDLDGDVDLALSVNRGRPAVLENGGEPRAPWLAVRLDASQTESVGARARVTGQGGDSDTRFFAGDVSFASDHSAEQVFGLGVAEVADLEVQWTDGRWQLLRQLPARHRIVVRR